MYKFFSFLSAFWSISHNGCAFNKHLGHCGTVTKTTNGPLNVQYEIYCCHICANADFFHIISSAYKSVTCILITALAPHLASLQHLQEICSFGNKWKEIYALLWHNSQQAELLRLHLNYSSVPFGLPDTKLQIEPLCWVFLFCFLNYLSLQVKKPRHYIQSCNCWIHTVLEGTTANTEKPL